MGSVLVVQRVEDGQLRSARRDDDLAEVLNRPDGLDGLAQTGSKLPLEVEEVIVRVR